ncbi:MAG: hypothetical protein E7660_04945 [Ruminococcaceae bacterium]|nr:hypothetical protein [Oscillospiraceae bacterium]
MSLKKLLYFSSIFIFSLFSLCGCTTIGEKSAGIWVIYGTTAVLSFLILIGYFCIKDKKEPWFFVLFSSVLIVNVGYLSLSISKTLEEALLANRISYLGSVFLPLSMLMIILGVAKIKYRKWLPGALIALGIVIFFIAASPGYLDIYYKEVSLQTVNGVTVLEKVYGPWHKIYLFYLLGYFGSMIGIVIYAISKKKMETPFYAVILAAAVFVNIGVWLIEQLVKVDFEILSISYIISEIFLLSLHLLMKENMRLKALVAENNSLSNSPEDDNLSALSQSDGKELKEKLRRFNHGLSLLTPTEHAIFDMYTHGKTTKEVMGALEITENTLKFHNKNLYGKLGVSSRKQLKELNSIINTNIPE